MPKLTKEQLAVIEEIEARRKALLGHSACQIETARIVARALVEIDAQSRSDSEKPHSDATRCT